jgi:anti-sigma-K factor RskA
LSPDFDELVGADLEPGERARLLRAHNLLVDAGPPPELPPSLEQPLEPRTADVVPFFNRRRHAAIAVLAAALALALFGAGFLTGHGRGGGGFETDRALAMRPTAAAPRGAVGLLALGNKDTAGNWPMLLSVSNLEKLPPRGYYAVWLTRKGKPIAPCGTFVVASAAETQVHLNAPYELNRFDGWVVTKQAPGHHEPGRVLLTTA